MFDDIFKQTPPDMVKKNITRQATKILKDIGIAYAEGMLDSPEAAYKYCSLLACICEGKMEGTLDEESGTVKWSLTKDYHAKLLEKMSLSEIDSSTNVIRGPWN